MLTLPTRLLESLRPPEPYAPSVPRPVTPGFQRPETTYDPDTMEPWAPPEMQASRRLYDAQQYADSLDVQPVPRGLVRAAPPAGPVGPPDAPIFDPGAYDAPFRPAGESDPYRRTAQPGAYGRALAGPFQAGIGAWEALPGEVHSAVGQALSPEEMLNSPSVPFQDPNDPYGTRLARTFNDVPVIGGALRKTFQYASPAGGENALRLAGEAAVGSELARGGVRALGGDEQAQGAAELLGSIAGPMALPRFERIGGRVYRAGEEALGLRGRVPGMAGIENSHALPPDTLSRLQDDIPRGIPLSRVNKIRRGRGLPPIDKLPEDIAPIARPFEEVTPEAVEALQAKVAREGMTPENRTLLDRALGALFKVEEAVPEAPPPIPENPRISGNLDRLVNPGKLEAQGSTVEDALKAARDAGRARLPEGYDATHQLARDAAPPTAAEMDDWITRWDDLEAKYGDARRAERSGTAITPQVQRQLDDFEREARPLFEGGRRFIFDDDLSLNPYTPDAVKEQAKRMGIGRAQERPRPTSRQRSIYGEGGFGGMKQRENDFLDEIRRGPNTDSGSGLQARIIPGLSPSSSTGAVLGAAGGYGTAGEDATPAERLRNAAIGSVAGALVAPGIARSWKANPIAGKALEAAEKAYAGRVGTAQKGYDAAQQAFMGATTPDAKQAAWAGLKKATDALDRARGASIASLMPPDVKEPAVRKALRVVADIGNVPRTLMSSLDFSGSLRQGGFLAPGRNPEWRAAMKAQFSALKSEGAAQAIQDEIESAPMAKFRKGTSLYQADWTGADLGQREEQFMSAIAGDLPGVKQTSRAYAVFLNKMRADVFDSIVSKWGEADRTPQRLETLAKYVNATTGRGELPAFMKDYAPVMNAAFFSPRFLMSIPQRHMFAFTRDSLIRNEAIKDLASFYGTGLTILGGLTAAKAAGLVPGMSIETDPRSSDWGKVRVGNTRVDIWGGNQQFARMMAQTVMGIEPLQPALGIKGNVKNVDTGKVSNRASVEVMTQFLRNKFSPVANLEEQARTGKGFAGSKPPGLMETAIRLVAPLTLQDMYDTYQATDDPVTTGLSAAGNSIGLGVQTFGKAKPSPRSGTAPVRPAPRPAAAPRPSLSVRPAAR